MGGSLPRIFSIAAALLLLFAILLLYVGDSLFSSSPLIIAGQANALLLSLWARLTLGVRSFHLAANPTPGALATTGPYRFLRHPIYSAVCLLTWSGIASHLSLASNRTSRIQKLIRGSNLQG